MFSTFLYAKAKSEVAIMKAGQRKRVWTAEQKKELGYKHI